MLKCLIRFVSFMFGLCSSSLISLPAFLFSLFFFLFWICSLASLVPFMMNPYIQIDIRQLFISVLP
ncbi:hypothetical protein BJX76DRAFT_319283 [Aspergillus varians]